MKIECIIVDDDAFAREDLKRLLFSQFSDMVDLVAEFSMPEEAVDYIKRASPQLVFLDVQMPGMNGFEMLDHLDTTRFDVIFCTSYDQYAIRAIKYSALDYLLKPIDANELASALARYRERSEKKLTVLRLSNLRHNIKAKKESDLQLVIATKQGEFQFPANDIVRCEADSNYTAIYFVDKKKFIASKTLGDIEEMLSPETFLRIHKSHLVNTSHIAHLTSDEELMMKDNSRIPISRRRFQDVKERVRRTM
jgi:two-component system LytT family response regulator